MSNPGGIPTAGAATDNYKKDQEAKFPHKAVSLEYVLDEEQREIKEIRNRRREHCQVEEFSIGSPRKPDTPLGPPIPGRPPTDVDKPKWQTRNDSDYAKWRDVIKAAHENNFVGLAITGGGIRSATFNLGVLQALAALKLLYRVDYLSTVSGGGYIGGWLTAWTKRQAGFKGVQESMARGLTSFGCTQTELEPNRVHQEDDKEPTPIRFLRVFSNYLTPKLGLFGGDTWAMVAVYLRNLLLNLAIVLAMVTTLLLVPRVVQTWATIAQRTDRISHILIAVVVALLLTAFAMILANMVYLDSRDKSRVPKWTSQGLILLVVSVPLFLAAVLTALWLAIRPEELKTVSLGKLVGIGASLYGGIWFIESILTLTYHKRIGGLSSKSAPQVANLRPAKELDSKPVGTKLTAKWPATRSSEILRQAATLLIGVVAAIAAGALAGWLYGLLAVVKWGQMQKPLTWDVPKALTLGVPTILGIFLLAGVLQIGLMGTTFEDWKREWWGRLGGWLLLFGTVWLVTFWTALYFPGFITKDAIVKKTWGWIAATYLTPAWILTTAASVLAGKSIASGKPGAQTWRDAVAKVGPYVFITGLVCWVSYGIYKVESPPPVESPWLMWTLGCLAVTLLMAWRVDINEFSMHLFYRNRLVRCYLGASNEQRSPNLFTGFDPNDDDIPLKNLRTDRDKQYDGPYPLLNASLNLVKGQDLAWQERKAESFVMTPLYCGYDVWLEEQDSPMLSHRRDQEKKEVQDKSTSKPLRQRVNNWLEWWRGLDESGYCRTEQYAVGPLQQDGLTLGTAMSISGAAASPNMGFYSSMPVAFLMTVFNVRLGQWLGNPRHRRKSERVTPGIGLMCMLSELFGQTDDHAPYVYLSDGGHFDNLGVYELVKRRCGLIIVCDAEEDGQYKFTGLANTIRKCRIDLGIAIDLDVSDLIPTKGSGFSKKHCAVGAIHYEQADVDAPIGRIVYFKAALTKDDPSDLKTYKARNPLFPHESTINQWFSESQFESYRQLGYHGVLSSIKPDAATQDPSPKSDVVSRLQEMVRGFSGSASVQSDGASKAEPLEKLLCRVFNEFGFDRSVRPNFPDVVGSEFKAIPKGDQPLSTSDAVMRTDREVKHLEDRRTPLSRFRQFVDSLSVVDEAIERSIQDVRYEHYGLQHRTGDADLKAKLSRSLQQAETLLKQRGLSYLDRDRIMRVLKDGCGIPPCILDSELQEVRAWLRCATTAATLACASALYHGRVVSLPGPRRILKEDFVNLVKSWIHRGEISPHSAPEPSWLIQKLIEEKLIRPFQPKEYITEPDTEELQEFHEGAYLRSVGKAAYLFEVDDPDRPHDHYPIGRFPGSARQETLA